MGVRELEAFLLGQFGLEGKVHGPLSRESSLALRRSRRSSAGGCLAWPAWWATGDEAAARQALGGKCATGKCLCRRAERMDPHRKEAGRKVVGVVSDTAQFVCWTHEADEAGPG